MFDSSDRSRHRAAVVHGRRPAGVSRRLIARRARRGRLASGVGDFDIRRPAPIFQGVADRSFVYFVHSYYCAAERPEDVAASCRYGEVEFAAALWRDNLFATQFHPEKSQNVGLSIFKNFGEL